MATSSSSQSSAGTDHMSYPTHQDNYGSQTDDARTNWERWESASEEFKHLLSKKGYKFLGEGVEQLAFQEPSTGKVLKIFNASERRRSSDVMQEWIAYCMDNDDNPFLPKYYGWTKFMHEGYPYYQIRTDRLYRANQDYAFFGSALAEMTEFIERYAHRDDKDAKRIWIDYHLENVAYGGDSEKLILLLGGEDKFDLLWSTLSDLLKMAKHLVAHLDLHEDNFMLAQDGTPIINDPFHVGGSY